MIDIIFISVAIVAVITLVSMLTGSNVNNDNTPLVYPEKVVRYFTAIEIVKINRYGQRSYGRAFDVDSIAAALDYYNTLEGAEMVLTTYKMINSYTHNVYRTSVMSK